MRPQFELLLLTTLSLTERWRHAAYLSASGGMCCVQYVQPRTGGASGGSHSSAAASPSRSASWFQHGTKDMVVLAVLQASSKLASALARHHLHCTRGFTSPGPQSPVQEDQFSKIFPLASHQPYTILFLSKWPWWQV